LVLDTAGDLCGSTGDKSRCDSKQFQRHFLFLVNFNKVLQKFRKEGNVLVSMTSVS
jgi:hypothetical protein